MKRYLGIVLTLVCCVLAIIGGRLYYTHRYLPVRTVQPIVKLLDEGTRDSIQKGAYLVRGIKIVRYSDGTSGMERDPNRIHIVGPGAEEVKSAMLRAMEKAGGTGDRQIVKKGYNISMG